MYQLCRWHASNVTTVSDAIITEIQDQTSSVMQSIKVAGSEITHDNY